MFPRTRRALCSRSSELPRNRGLRNRPYGLTLQAVKKVPPPPRKRHPPKVCQSTFTAPTPTRKRPSARADQRALRVALATLGLCGASGMPFLGSPEEKSKAGALLLNDSTGNPPKMSAQGFCQLQQSRPRYPNIPESQGKWKHTSSIPSPKRQKMQEPTKAVEILRHQQHPLARRWCPVLRTWQTFCWEFQLFGSRKKELGVLWKFQGGSLWLVSEGGRAVLLAFFCGRNPTWVGCKRWGCCLWGNPILVHFRKETKGKPNFVSPNLETHLGHSMSYLKGRTPTS